MARLIRASGFDPLKAGGIANAARIPAPGGDLHQFGLNGELVDLDRALGAVAAEPMSATRTTALPDKLFASEFKEEQ